MADPLDIIDDRRVAHSLGKDEPVAEAQDYLDLDAAGFLLVALGHLTAAKEKLGEMPKSAGVWKANRSAQWAANQVRYALKVLEDEKEKTCEKS